jgi:hypothetical protein
MFSSYGGTRIDKAGIERRTLTEHTYFPNVFFDILYTSLPLMLCSRYKCVVARVSPIQISHWVLRNYLNFHHIANELKERIEAS